MSRKKTRNPYISRKDWLTERDLNPTGFGFIVPGARALIINEFGYKTHDLDAPNRTWFRAEGVYNFSHYNDGKNGQESNNNPVLFGAMDYQFPRFNQTTGYRGWYLGASVHNAPADRNVFTEYYESRLYGLGFFPSHPADIISFSASHTKYSNHARTELANLKQSTSPGTGKFTAAYTYRLANGIYTSLAAPYVGRPTFTPTKKNAVLLTAGLNFIF